MKIESYFIKGVVPSQMNFQKVELHNVNLLVGDTGTGKTRFLNTIFNLGVGAISKDGIKAGHWEITFRIGEHLYAWTVEAKPQTFLETSVQFESLKKYDKDGSETILVSRTPDLFEFKGEKLPKLPANVCSIFLLKSEEEIKPIYNGFASIMRRNFSQDEMTRNARYEPLPVDLINRMKGMKKLDDLFLMDFTVNSRLYFLSTMFKDVFSNLVKQYKSIFPFITEVTVKDQSELNPTSIFSGITPVFCIKENNINNWIEYELLSSGMQKVLLILTDAMLLPEGGIYLIDEYENSLGVNAINFFPTFLLSEDNPHQFIITSHHPYLINKIPSSNWYVFHRDGPNVSIMYGKQLTDKFGKSKQQAFLQLINDPFYTKGIQQ